MMRPALVAADGVTPLFGQASASAQPMHRGAETRSQALSNWNPPGASADKAALRERRLIANRAEDLARNNPIAIAAITRLVDMIVGAGLRFSSKPSAAALGITREQALDLGKQIERELARHANDPRKRWDAQRKVSANGLYRLMARSFVKLDEACVVATWREGHEHRYGSVRITLRRDGRDRQRGCGRQAEQQGSHGASQNFYR